MPSVAGISNWARQHADALLVGGALVTGALIVAGARSATASRANRASDETCPGCGPHPATGGPVFRTPRRSFVTDAAGPTLRNLGYVGYSIGPLGRYPGARGPAPPTPTYGSYRGQGRYTFADEQGPQMGGRTPIQAVGTRQAPYSRRDLWDGWSVGGQRPTTRARLGLADRSDPGPVGQETGSFYRNPVSLANHIDIQTQDYPGGEGGYNLAVGNLPPGAEGNLSAPVTYQQINRPGGIASADWPDPIPPYLSQGGGGYLAFGRENGPAPGWKYGVQSIATAQEALSDQGWAPETFPWWHPGGQNGPLGYAGSAEVSDRSQIYDEGGGYVSPGAYYVGADGRYKKPYTAYGSLADEAQAYGLSDEALADQVGYAPLEDVSVVGQYITPYQALVRANTIAIQTQDFPGGEGGYNLAVGNLPPSANGNLSAPVTYQQINRPGGIASADWPDPILPLLDWFGQQR